MIQFITQDVSNKMLFTVDDKHVIKALRQKNVTVLGDFLRNLQIKIGHVDLWSNC